MFKLPLRRIGRTVFYSIAFLLMLIYVQYESLENRLTLYMRLSLPLERFKVG